MIWFSVIDDEQIPLTAFSWSHKSATSYVEIKITCCTIALVTFIWINTYRNICCNNRFTSLCKNLFNVLEFLAGAFWCHVHHFQCLTVPVELLGTIKHWKWCTWHQKASAKNSNKFLHSEVNLLIQHIIVQDHDGQNNNI